MAPLVRYFRAPGPSHYKLKIQKYSVIAKSKLSRYESRNFSAGSHSWALIVYPNGNKRGNNHLSLELRLVDNHDAEILVEAKFFLFHKSDDKYLTVQVVKEVWRYHAVNTTWGIDKFISLNELKAKYRQNDTIIVGVEILIVNDTNKATSLTTDDLSQKPKSHQLKTPYYSNRAPPMTFLRAEAPAHYILEIRYASAIFNYPNHLYESPNFTVGGIKWKLIVCLNGSMLDGGYLSFGLGLAQKSNREKILVNAKLFLYDRNTRKYFTVQDVEKVWRYDNIKTSWGFDKFIPLKDIMDRVDNRYIKDKSIILGAEIFIVKNNGKGETITIIKPPKKPKPKIFRWTIRNFFKQKSRRILNKKVMKFGGHQWKLVVYPKGIYPGKSKTSVFLKLVDSSKLSPNKTIYVEYTLRIKNPNPKTPSHYKKKVAYNFSPRATYGGGETIHFHKVKKPSWIKKHLTLVLEVVAWSRVAKFS